MCGQLSGHKLALTTFTPDISLAVGQLVFKMGCLAERMEMPGVKVSRTRKKMTISTLLVVC